MIEEQETGDQEELECGCIKKRYMLVEMPIGRAIQFYSKWSERCEKHADIKPEFSN